MVPIPFHPVQAFNQTKHTVDLVAKRYLCKASDDVHHLLPVDVSSDGNCLYHSIGIFMNNSTVTTDELRGRKIVFFYGIVKFIRDPFLVRTIVELTSNEDYYQALYSDRIGPTDSAIKSICKNFTFSELYEIAALCNVLKCNIRSVYPKIDFRHYMALWDSVFTPSPPALANFTITILWSNAQNENVARALNRNGNNMWSPNHFVPLLSPNIQEVSDNHHQTTSISHVVGCSLSNKPSLNALFSSDPSEENVQK